MTPAEVLDILIKNLGMNPKTFSEALGFDRPQAIYDILNGKTKSVSSRVANKILSVFPEINRSWLLTGQGCMVNTGDISYSGNSNNKGIIGTVTGNIVNNVNAYGYEKIIKPDGTLVLELAKPNSKNVVGAQEIVMEYNTLQAKIKLLEEKCAAKDETIQALKMTIDVLSSKANK